MRVISGSVRARFSSCCIRNVLYVPMRPKSSTLVRRQFAVGLAGTASGNVVISWLASPLFPNRSFWFPNFYPPKKSRIISQNCYFYSKTRMDHDTILADDASSPSASLSSNSSTATYSRVEGLRSSFIIMYQHTVTHTCASKTT